MSNTSKPERTLTAKQARFVEEYMIDLNATQAAIRSGYKASSAADIGRQLLRNTPVARAIAERKRVISERIGVTAERVVSEIARIALSDIRKAVSWRSSVDRVVAGPGGNHVAEVVNEVVLKDSDEIDDDTALAIAEISMTEKGALKIKMHEKLGALDKLARHLGLYAPTKTEVTGADGEPLGSARSLTDEELVALARRGGA